MADVVTLATVSELADWLGEPIEADSSEAKRAAMCLRAASVLVRKESGRTWLDDDGELVEPLPEEVRLITLYCASRVFDNRNAQTRGVLDDYSEAWKVEESGAYLTDSERRTLAGFRSSFRGLGTVSTTRDSVAHPTGYWAPTDTPGVFFPWL